MKEVARSIAIKPVILSGNSVFQNAVKAMYQYLPYIIFILDYVMSPEFTFS